MKEGVVIQGVDTIDIVKFISRKNKVFQAMALSDLEQIIDPKSEEFFYIRKLILDYSNNFARSIVRTIFGDVEY